jgi:hypothetical protein
VFQHLWGGAATLALSKIAESFDEFLSLLIPLEKQYFGKISSA